MNQQILIPQITSMAVFVELLDGSVHQVNASNIMIEDIKSILQDNGDRIEIIDEKIEGLKLIPPVGFVSKCPITNNPKL